MGCDLEHKKCKCKWYYTAAGHYIDKYRVVKLLGKGNNSKVFLGEDLSRNRRTTYVAIKILRRPDWEYDSQAKEAEYRREQDIMIKIARHKEQPGLSHEGLRHLMSADQVLQSRSGRPRAFVIEPLTMSLYDLVAHLRNRPREKLAPDLASAIVLPPDTIKRITKGMLLGLEFLHDRIEAIYLGMKPRNLILRLPDMKNVIRRELWLNTSAATDSLVPIGMSYLDSDVTLKYLLDHVEVVLTDYGRSEWDFRREEREERDFVAPTFMRPPEALRSTYVLDKSFDIWDIGVCLRFMIEGRVGEALHWGQTYMHWLWQEVGPITAAFMDVNGGRHIFAFREFVNGSRYEYRNGKPYGPKEHTAANCEFLAAIKAGSLVAEPPARPLSMLWDLDEMTEWYGPPGEALAERMAKYFPKDQVASWITFLGRCWTLYHPNRPTAKMLLNHPFFFGVSSLAPTPNKRTVRGIAIAASDRLVAKDPSKAAHSLPPASARTMSSDAKDIEDIDRRLHSRKRPRSKSVVSRSSQISPEANIKVTRKKRAMTVAGAVPANAVVVQVHRPQIQKQHDQVLLMSIKQDLVPGVMDIPVVQAIPVC